MADREKVIKGLEHCSNKSFCNDGCPYSSILRDPNLGIDECMTCLAHDALELLKEQEPKLVIPGYNGVYCPSCSSISERMVGLKKLSKEMSFCPYCGQAVKCE